MSRKVITGYYQGLNLSSNYTKLDITASGRIGKYGVYCAGPIVVTNAGTIQAYSYHFKGYDGLRLNAGGTVKNDALIEGFAGVIVASAPGTVINRGTIEGLGDTGYGVRLEGGGVVTNGAGHHSALISGYDGIFIYGPGGTVNNFGTVTGTIGPNSVGVYLECPGQVVNGSTTDARALIEGESRGVGLSGSNGLINFGTIAASVGLGGYGAFLIGPGATLTNGAAGDTKALIEGYDGIVAYTGDTVTNFGVIAGEGGAALTFGANTDVLVVEAGCAFTGAVLGGGGTLDLDTGTGKISALPGAGAITVSGSMAATVFQNFATLEIGAAAQFTLKGSGTVNAGQAVSDAGTLTLATATKASIVNAGLVETTGTGVLTVQGAVVNDGTLIANGGSLVVHGAVTGTGKVQIGAGTLEALAGFTQNVAFTGSSGALELGASRTYTGTIGGFSRTGQTVLDLLDIPYVGGSTTATFSGSTSSGVLTVTNGTLTAHITLKGNYLDSAFTVSSDNHGGVNVIDPRASPVASPAPAATAFTAAMASMGAPADHIAIGRHAWAAGPITLLAPHAALA